jgi:hypothetical protein
MSHTFTWSPAPAEAGVLYYLLERSSDGGATFEVLAQIPNRQDGDDFDFENQQFRYTLAGDEVPGDVLRIASVSDTVGPYAYFYTPNPPPPPPIPVLELGGPKSPYKDNPVQRPVPTRLANRISAPTPATSSPRRNLGTLAMAAVAVTVAVIVIKAIR